MFSSDDLCLELLGVASALFCVTQLVSRSSPILRVWSGRKKWLLVRLWYVSVSSASTSCQMCFCVVACCFNILSSMVYCCASVRSKILTVSFLFLLSGVVLAPNLVTTTGFQTIFRAAGLVATQKHIALRRPRAQSTQCCSPPRLLHPALLPPPHQKNTVFSMISGSATPYFVARKNKKTCLCRWSQEAPRRDHGFSMMCN